MASIYRVEYVEMIQMNGEKEAESSGSNDSYNVQAENVEEAIARVRKRLVGKKREVKGIEDETYRGKCVDIEVRSCEYITSFDF